MGTSLFTILAIGNYAIGLLHFCQGEKLYGFLFAVCCAMSIDMRINRPKRKVADTE